VNCLVIVGVQWLVVCLTKNTEGAGLLVVVGVVWVVSWLFLETALFLPTPVAAGVFVMAFAVFAMGETMYAPVLGPLTAAIAPQGMVGTTLGALSALRTGVSAAGPLLAGVLLALDLPHVFVLGHVLITAAAVALAWRLLRLRTSVPVRVDNEAEDTGGLASGSTERPVPVA
jgi:hypothetical protein